MAGRSCCRAAHGTRAATCNQHGPRSSRVAVRRPSPSQTRWDSPASITTGPRAGASNRLARCEMCTRNGLVTRNGPQRLRDTEVKQLRARAALIGVAGGCLITLAFLSITAFAQTPLNAPQSTPNLGRPVSEADLAAWDISILPDGTGLPAGSGTPEQGAKIFATKCALCHGPEGKGGTAAAVVGGAPLTNGIDTPKTIANFWPYATTLFDFTRRAMPWQQPRKLTNDEVYALTAYILSLNKIIGPSDTMNAQTLPKVRMPNRDGFVVRFPEKMP